MKLSPRTSETQAEVTPDIQEALARRSERLKAKPNAVEDQAILWVAEFPVGQDVYALPLDCLRACLPLRGVVPVPLSPAHVIGVVRYQGQTVCAISLSALLEERGWRKDPSVLLIVEHARGQLIALDCEQIPTASTLGLAAVQTAKSRESGPVVPVTTAGARQVQLIDLPRLLARRKEGRRGP